MRSDGGQKYAEICGNMRKYAENMRKICGIFLLYRLRKISPLAVPRKEFHDLTPCEHTYYHMVRHGMYPHGILTYYSQLYAMKCNPIRIQLMQ